MARPKEFDRDLALRKAMMVFWEKGYAATSAADLVQAMGIGRQSLYDTFGDKHQLYLEALALYSEASVAELVQSMRAARPLEAIEAMLMAFAARPEEQNALGCMGINSICELGLQDEAVNAVRARSGAPLRTSLIALLEQAKAAGDADPALDPAAGADFILATLAGMKVIAKGGADAQALRSVGALAVQALGRGRPQTS
ncbi:TetR/AcrR family transcriptional regulator [Massilia sp. SM-13]|uniref:TetR/AcrR family transcriptional regulator n=1 Tax=Pseudoduganella rhizocola TaxID=3382643 RepID=UPI0038B44E06